MKQHWLKDWPWETVVTINAGLCQEKKALHKPTSDGYETAKKLWEKARGQELTLRETLDLCRRCHKLAPFCFYNGNTFAAIGRTLIQDLLRKLPPVRRPSRTRCLTLASFSRALNTPRPFWNALNTRHCSPGSNHCRMSSSVEASLGMKLNWLRGFLDVTSCSGRIHTADLVKPAFHTFFFLCSTRLH